MDAAALSLFAVAGVLLFGALGRVVFQRTGVPDAAWLLAVGALLGPGFGLIEQQLAVDVAAPVAPVLLTMLLLDAGLKLRADDVVRFGPRSGLLALANMGIIVLFVAPLLMLGSRLGALPPHWSWAHAFWLSLMISGMASRIVLPCLSRARVDASVVGRAGVEAALSDVVIIVVVTQWVNAAAAADGGALSILLHLVVVSMVGLVLGVAGGALILALLRLLLTREYAYPLVLASSLVVYFVTNRIGGSGALAVAVAAILLGNLSALGKKLRVLRPVELGSTPGGLQASAWFVAGAIMFPVAGMVFGPPSWAATATGIAAGLLIAALRVPSVLLAYVRSDKPLASKLLLGTLSPRGLTSVAVSAFAVNAGVAGSEFKVVVASAVAATVAAFAIAFPLVRRRVADPDVLSIDLSSDPASRVAEHVAPDPQARRTLRSTSDADAIRETQPSVNLEGQPVAVDAGEPIQRGPLPPPTPPPPRGLPNRTTQPGMPVPPAEGDGRKPDPNNA